MKEEWKPVKGFESYFVSNLGRVKSYKSGKVLKPHFGSCGYLNVFLYDGHNHKSTMKIHRLVATAFIENPKDKPQVNHLDGNKHNNTSINLEWVTNGENLKHAFKNGLKTLPKGENNPGAKVTDDEIDSIRELLASGIVQSRIAEKFNISPQVISRIKLGERKKTYE